MLLLTYPRPHEHSEDLVHPLRVVGWYVEVYVLGSVTLDVEHIEEIVASPLHFKREVGALKDFLISVDCLNLVEYFLE